MNGSKHLRIDRPSIDAKHLTVQEYVPGPVGSPAGTGSSFRLLVLYRGAQERLDLIELCATCVRLFGDFLQQTKGAFAPSTVRPDF